MNCVKMETTANLGPTSHDGTRNDERKQVKAR